ncbi:MAG: bifunctional DNA primase/polymerase, partial [Acidimicrobiales bacterium]
MLIDHAASYCQKGWVPIPTFEIVTRSAGLVCSCPAGPGCPSPGKHPRVAWRDLERPDEAKVTTWWTRWPGAGIALLTGLTSGLVVVDVDPGHGGEASLAALVAEHGPLPDTLAVTSGGGGRHYYFGAPAQGLSNDAGRALGPGLDVRADGGIVVAPPTRHVSGGRYEWAEAAPLAPLPAWVAARLTRAPGPAPSPPSLSRRPGEETAYGPGALV